MYGIWVINSTVHGQIGVYADIPFSIRVLDSLPHKVLLLAGMTLHFQPSRDFSTPLKLNPGVKPP